MDIANFPSWVTWVFSGIGCLIISCVVSIFFRKRNTTNSSKNKSKVKGSNNTVVQGSENTNITIKKNE